MFAAVALLLCIVDLSTAHLMDLSHDEYTVVFQGYIVLLCVAGVLSNGSQRDRSVMAVLLIWAIWVFITDQYGMDLPNVLVSYEAAFFTAIVLWALVRPYFYVSHQINPNNVCIAFYHGTHAPVLSSLSALVGLPFSSVAIVAGDSVLRPRGGSLCLTKASDFKHPDYTIIDTGRPVTDDISKAISGLAGKSVKRFGLRLGCVATVLPVLRMIGLKPKSFIPSRFYYQVVKHAGQ